jgi:hypothetical protein
VADQHRLAAVPAFPVSTGTRLRLTPS